jgi:hypothetical protein
LECGGSTPLWIARTKLQNIRSTSAINGLDKGHLSANLKSAQMKIIQSYFLTVLFIFSTTFLNAEEFSEAAANSKPVTPLRIGLADGFETGHLADFWLPADYGSGRYVPGRVKFSTNIVRSGKYSVELTVREGDVKQTGAENTINERTELDSGKYPLYGKEICYGFSFLVPKDFPIVDVRLVISQIKQSDGDGPLIAQRYRDGAHTISIESHGKKKRYTLPKIRKGEWQDMIYRVRYHDQDGYIDMWMNGKKVVTYKGPLGNSELRNLFYHKIGLYRDRMREPMRIYFDNYRIGPTIESVDPAKFPKQ